jgi:hypothetical protein
MLLHLQSNVLNLYTSVISTNTKWIKNSVTLTIVVDIEVNVNQRELLHVIDSFLLNLY